jgi:hypothetical protein
MASSRSASDPERVRHSDVAYESRDLNHHAVFVFLLILACAGVVIHIALWGVFHDLGKSQYAGHQTTNPIMTSNEQLKEVGGDPALSFPMPRLQPDDIADLNKFRVREEDELNSYGWVDQNRGTIHIPIERAVEMLGGAWPQQEETLSTNATARGPDAQASQGKNQTEKVIKDDRAGNYGW